MPAPVLGAGSASGSYQFASDGRGDSAGPNIVQALALSKKSACRTRGMRSDWARRLQLLMSAGNSSRKKPKSLTTERKKRKKRIRSVPDTFSSPTGRFCRFLLPVSDGLQNRPKAEACVFRGLTPARRSCPYSTFSITLLVRELISMSVIVILWLPLVRSTRPVNLCTPLSAAVNV